jgi:hypothetical protein
MALQQIVNVLRKKIVDPKKVAPTTCVAKAWIKINVWETHKNKETTI